MQNTKIYLALQYFDKYEHNRLYKYISSPYFNKHPAPVKLYELLKVHIFSDKKRALSKDSLWAAIFSEEIYDDVRFRKLCSDLLKLVEGFLAQEVYKQNPLHQASYLLDAVVSRKMEELYQSSRKTASRLANSQAYESTSRYFYQYQIENTSYKLETEKEFKRDLRTNFEEIVKNLDWFYIAEKLKYYCDFLSQQTLVTHDYKLLFIDEIIEYIKNNDVSDIPLISIYYQIYLTQIDAVNASNYFKLQDLIFKYIDKFPKEDAFFIYNHTLNYCIRKVNAGIHEFLDEYFNTYKKALESGVFIIDDELSPWHFRNIIIAALRLGNYEWVENFIREYKEKLPKAFRENAVTFNLSTLYFYQKKYDKVIELLREVEYEDLSYNLNSKTTLLLTYYETDEYDALDFLLESFRTYLQRRKNISPKRRKSYQDLIKFTKKLTRIMPGDKKALERLKQEIDNTQGIASEKWLREKIGELE